MGNGSAGISSARDLTRDKSIFKKNLPKYTRKLDRLTSPCTKYSFILNDLFSGLQRACNSIRGGNFRLSQAGRTPLNDVQVLQQHYDRAKAAAGVLPCGLLWPWISGLPAE